MNEQMTFKRYELKYMLTRRQKDALLRALEGRLRLDRYGHSTIRNIYFDTDTFRLVRRSIEKPLYKEKLRVRSYQQAGPQTPVFVELKKKFESVVYKRRLILPHRQAMDALENNLPLPIDSQIGREIAAFREFYGETLLPAMLLTYEREAYFPVDGADFRLTLDENVLWRMEEIDLGAFAYGNPVIGNDQVLLEIKTPGGIPLWMTHFLSENKIYQTSFSKYGTAYQQWLRGEDAMGGMKYAG
ncbi:MAG: polyphosphate polymerase domain-containing protein [Clostridia bacterium]|nr:polyphosphate polymerase domain-containing protein [Clostridia bacterium]